jgi:hypothetical protein
MKSKCRATFAAMTPPPGPRRCPATKRFAPRYDQLALLAVVRAVSSYAAAHANPPKAPTAITQVEYDSARSDAGFAPSKRAFRICAQLGASWAKVLETAHLEGRPLAQTAGKLGPQLRALLTEDEVVEALQAVARRLHVETLRPHEYDRELAVTELEQSRAWLHGSSIPLFPSSSRIDTQFGWDAALELAGLVRRAAPARPAKLRPRGTWTLTRCVESLMTALEEAAERKPGTKLTQPVYRELAAGRADLAPMGTITFCARVHDTTFSAIRNELIAWRAAGAVGEPRILIEAREIDALPTEDRPASVRSRARTQERRRERIAQETREPWADELLAALAELGEPVAMKDVLAQLRWDRNKTVRRMRKLEEAGRVERVNHGTSRRTVLWRRPPKPTVPSGPPA